METPIRAGRPPSQCQGNMTRSTSLILALPSTSAVPMADTFPWSRRVEWQVQPDIPQTLGAFESLGMLGPFKLMDLQWFSSPCVWGNRGSNPPLCSPGWIDEELVVRVRLQTSEWADKSPEPWSLERDCFHYFPIISLSFSNLKVPGWLMEMSECKGRILDPSLSPSPCCQIPVWKAGLRYTEISSIWYIYDIDIKTLVPWWTSLVSWYSWISWHDLSPYVSWSKHGLFSIKGDDNPNLFIGVCFPFFCESHSWWTEDHTTDNIDRWKSSRRIEKRREEERRSEKRKSQRKEDADARKGRKVAKHCVFQWFVAPQGRKVGC